MQFIESIAGFPWAIIGAVLIGVGTVIGGTIGTIVTILGIVTLIVLAINSFSYGWGKAGSY